MRLAWATDVHLNFLSEARVAEWCAELRAAGPEGLLLGGDIAEAPSLLYWLRFLEQELERPIWFVLGNHDYYRGSVAGVHADLVRLKSQWLRWLPKVGVVPLSSTTALVGQGGWGDARHGDFLRSPIQLNDYRLIEELTGTPDKETLQRRLQAQGDREAARLRPHLEAALAAYPEVVLLTHVPPFREACWYEGRISDDDWAPGFTCQAIGDLLREALRAHPGRRLTVYCGHTHGAGTARLGPDLLVHTGAAEYGRPAFQLLELP